MPPWPMAMPSSMAMVLNSRAARRRRPRSPAATTLPDVVQVHVAGHELGEAVGDGDDRLAEVRRRVMPVARQARGRRPCCGPGW